jgi:hypothetical protein
MNQTQRLQTSPGKPLAMPAGTKQAGASPAPTKGPVKLNRRGLIEMIFACAFLSLFTLLVWTWQNKGGYVAAMGQATLAGEASLMVVILRNPVIMASTVVTEFTLLLALTLAVAPVTWWLRTDYLMAAGRARAMTPLRWLGQKLKIVGPEQANVQGAYVTNATGELIFVPAPTAEDSEEQEVVMVQQPDGTLMAMVQQTNGTMVPAETKPGEAQKGQGAESTEPILPTPEQANNALNFEEQEEDPLADLADIGDILSSAFDEDSAVDPEREAISRSLDEVDVMDLLLNARNVLATFRQ